MLPISNIATMNSPINSDVYNVFFKDTGEYLNTNNDMVDVLTDGEGYIISMWIYLTDAQRGDQVLYGAIGDSDNSYEVGINTYGQLYVAVEVDGVSADDATNLFWGYFLNGSYDGWTHLLISHQNDSFQQFRVTKNGETVQVLDTTMFGFKKRDDFTNNNNFYIGARNNEGSADRECYKLYVSEFAIYKGIYETNGVALMANANEIMNNRTWYNHAEGRWKNYLHSWWRFGDGDENAQGPTIYDMSGNGRHATGVGINDNDYKYLDNGKNPWN